MIRQLVAAVFTVASLTVGTAAKADYLWQVEWGGSWVFNPGYPTEDPPQGSVEGTVFVRTPSKAGTYRIYVPADQGVADDLLITLAVTPGSDPLTFASAEYSGSFETNLEGGDALTPWSFGGESGGSIGSLYADFSQDPMPGMGYGGSSAYFEAYAVPEPDSWLLAIAGLPLLAAVARRARSKA